MRLTVIALVLVALVVMCGIAVADTSHAPPNTMMTATHYAPSAILLVAISHGMVDATGDAIIEVTNATPATNAFLADVVTQVDNSAVVTDQRVRRHWRVKHRDGTKSLTSKNRTPSRRMWAYGQAVYPLRA